MKGLRLSLIVILAVSLVAISAASADAARFRVLPPGSRVEGLPASQWSAIEFQAIFSIPAPDNPGLGAPWSDCYLERIGSAGLGIAFFLTSGTFTCEMPSGMTLIQPIIGSECSTLEAPPFYGETPTELRDCAHTFVPANLQAIIDGVSIPDLGRYLVTSPLYRFTVPDDNVLGVPAGSGYSVAYGTYLMLRLSPGQHTMHLAGSFPDFGFDYAWDYNITVTP